MGFNYAKEKKRFDDDWKRLQKEYEDACMEPDDIKAMYTYDWNSFLARRTYENHTQPLPDTYLYGYCGDMSSTLFKRFSSLSVTFGVEDFPGRYAWIDTISNADCHAKLVKLSTKDLELLTFIVLEGHEQSELALKWGCSQSAISQRFKKIKKFLK